MTVKESIDILLAVRSRVFESKSLAKTKRIPVEEMWGHLMGYNFDVNHVKLPDDHELSQLISKLVLTEFGEGVGK